MYALPLEDPIYVTTDRNSCSLDAVMQLLGETHWAASRSPETVRLSMENSLCFFMLEGRPSSASPGSLRIMQPSHIYAMSWSVRISRAPAAVRC